MKERLEDFASAQEKRTYIQGYVDCVQALYHMGLLKEKERIRKDLNKESLQNNIIFDK